MSSNGPASQPNRGQVFFNRVLYDRLPGFYNALDKLTLGVWWRLVSHALDYVPAGGRVLEVGFGPGRLQVELARQAQLAAGIDLAGGMCRYTYRRLAAQGLPSNIVRGSVCQLPYRAHSFDVVVSTFAISGLIDVQGAVSEMARMTSSGGRVVIVDIGLPADGNPVGTFWARLWETMGDFLHDYPAAMQQAGLAVTTCEEFGPGRHIRTIVGERPASR